MRRSGLVLLGWVLSMGTASALQLGGIEITTPPPQSIEARIELLHATPAELQDAEVAIAGAREHTEAGINPARIPEALKLSLVADADGEAILLALPAQMPPERQVFDFIVELQWSGGRLTRAYGLTREAGALQAVALAQTRYGPTQRADTLYSIANALRPPAVATNQMMLALLAENPSRFNAPNINALQRDVLLRLPQPEALQFPDRATADDEVRRQLADWGQGTPEAVAPREPVASGEPAESAQTLTPPSASLRLLPPAQPAAPEAESDFGAAEFEALAEQLNRVEAANQALMAQNRDLQRSITALQDDVARLQTLVTEGQSEGVGSTERGSGDAAPVSAEAVAAWIQAEWAAVMAEPRLALQRPWSRGLIIGLVVFFALLLFAWLLGRRRAVPKPQSENALPEQWRPQTGRTERTDAIDEAEIGPTSVRETETVATDPLDRASELIAYGQLAQAQSVLDDALGETPDSIGLRLRLLEVLAMRGDQSGFVSEAHVLHAQIDDDNDPRWQRVTRQGRELSPDHPLFATPE